MILANINLFIVSYIKLLANIVNFKFIIRLYDQLLEINRLELKPNTSVFPITGIRYICLSVWIVRYCNLRRPILINSGQIY